MAELIFEIFDDKLWYYEIICLIIFLNLRLAVLWSGDLAWYLLL